MSSPHAARDHSPLRLALAVPAACAGTPAELDARRLDCQRLGIHSVVLDVAVLDRVLGAPVPTVPLEPPPDNGMAFGLLELEEDVLRDSYELARQTFDVQLRAWRTGTRLDALDDMRHAWHRAGVTLDILHAPDLVTSPDEDLIHACRLAAAIGARVVSTTMSPGGLSRLAPIARHQGVRLSPTGDAAIGEADLERLLADTPDISVSIDIAARADDERSPLSFIERHADRVSHVRLGDAAWPMPGPNRPDAAVHHVLRRLRAGAWDFPVVIDVERDDVDEWIDEATRAIAWCRAVR